jgi:hypothetical protein
MKFIPYEDLPLYIAENGSNGEYIFAETASLSVSQPNKPVRQLQDNTLSICEFGLGSTMNYVSPNFSASTNYNIAIGPSGGPPIPLSTSIYKIPKDTKITFPNGKHLYFAEDIFPDGHNYLAKVYSKDGGWTLTQQEAQSGYFEPIFDYVSTGPVQGDLEVSFYINTGNLQSFFNITGLSNALQYPPINENKLTGFLGDFAFTCAHLRSLDFSLAPNGISQASAKFGIYGEIKKVDGLSNGYYSTSLYQQQSIPHGQNSQIIGTDPLGIEHTTSFNYSIKVDTSPRYAIPTGSSNGPEGIFPDRVCRKSTRISMTLNGENINPEIVSDGGVPKRANLKATLKDLSYNSFEDNSNGFMHTFNCSGVINNYSLSVGSQEYLNGSISVSQLYR